MFRPFACCFSPFSATSWIVGCYANTHRQSRLIATLTFFFICAISPPVLTLMSCIKSSSVIASLITSSLTSDRPLFRCFFYGCFRKRARGREKWRSLGKIGRSGSNWTGAPTRTNVAKVMGKILKLFNVDCTLCAVNGIKSPLTIFRGLRWQSHPMQASHADKKAIVWLLARRIVRNLGRRRLSSPLISWLIFSPIIWLFSQISNGSIELSAFSSGVFRMNWNRIIEIALKLFCSDSCNGQIIHWVRLATKLLTALVGQR